MKVKDIHGNEVELPDPTTITDRLKKAEEGIQWKELGKAALRETGRACLNAVAVVGAFMVLGYKVEKAS